MGYHKETVGDFDFVCRLRQPVLTMQEVCPSIEATDAPMEAGPTETAPTMDTALDVIRPLRSN